MSDIRRFSSRRQRLDQAFLSQKLQSAKSYRCIAGYFRSSIFELVGEEISTIATVQVVCNSEFHAADVLNLVYHETQDEQVYTVISRRMKDRYDIFGSLPDMIEDDWIENVEELEKRMDEYIHLRAQAHNVFEMRYQETIDPDRDRWELCSRVLARRDIVDKLSAP